MKRTVLLSSTILAIITVLELSQPQKHCQLLRLLNPQLMNHSKCCSTRISRCDSAEIEMVENMRVRDSSCLGRAKNKSYFQGIL
jgi:hypothetical protein